MWRLARDDAGFAAGVGSAFAAIFALRLSHGTPGDGVSLLYVLPVSLIAVRHGVGAGLAAATVAMALLVAWVVIDDVHLTWLGYLTRAAVFAVSGGAVGVLEQRMRGAQARRHALAVHDEIVQGLATARYSFEHGRTEDAIALLDETLEKARASVTEQLGGTPRPGDLRRPVDR